MSYILSSSNIIDFHSGEDVVSPYIIQICKNVRGRHVIKYFLNTTVLFEFGLFVRGIWQVNAFIDAYPSWSASLATCHYCIFSTWNWTVMRSFKVLEDQRGLSSLLFINLVSCERSDPKSYHQSCILITFPEFWFWWPMIQLQELLLTKPITYSDSPALLFLITCTGNDSCWGLLGFPPCCCFWRWVLPLHHHPPWHIAVKLGYGVGTMWDRPAPKFLKAVNAQACNEYLTKKSHAGPCMLGIFLRGRVLPPLNSCLSQMAEQA